jgi:hypothetical protein
MKVETRDLAVPEINKIITTSVISTCFGIVAILRGGDKAETRSN